MASFSRKMKRKGESTTSEMLEGKRRKILENAKKFIERRGVSIQEAARHFGVVRRSLSAYLKYGFQNLGRPSFLKEEDVSNFCTYLSALDTANMQQSTLSASRIMQQLSGSKSKPSAPTVRKYVQETGMNIRKARSADPG